MHPNREIPALQGILFPAKPVSYRPKNLFIGDSWHTGMHSAAHFDDATPSALSGPPATGNRWPEGPQV